MLIWLLKFKEESLTDTEKLMEKLHDELTAVQLQTIRISILTKETEANQKRYQRLIENYEKQKDKMLQDAKKQANQLLEEAKQEIDIVVEDLKKSSTIKPHVVIDAKRNLDLLKHEEKKRNKQ